MSVKIVDCRFVRGLTGFYFDDQKAIKGGAERDGNIYRGSPATPGFSAIRQAGESVSVLLKLENGAWAHGDCAAVQYSGAGGRDPLFLASEAVQTLEKHVAPWLIGRDMSSFRELSGTFDSLVCPATGQIYHTAIRYGVSQALLDAVAKASGRLMCEVVADEYGLSVSDEPIPVFCQTGDERYGNADKIILKGAQVLPHALINNVPEKLGAKGEKLLEYVSWLRGRILEVRSSDSYEPVLHIDVYGTIGMAFGDRNTGAICDYLARLSEAAKPFRLRIEGPVDVGALEPQIEALAGITRELDSRSVPVEIVADEWCNTLEDIRAFADAKAGHMAQIKTPDLGAVHNVAEAVIYCREKGMGAYQGGTCNETDRSAQVCVHLAMATRPAQMLAKPGMGVDEGYMIVTNEMNRILELRKQVTYGR